MTNRSLDYHAPPPPDHTPANLTSFYGAFWGAHAIGVVLAVPAGVVIWEVVRGRPTTVTAAMLLLLGAPVTSLLLLVGYAIALRRLLRATRDERRIAVIIAFAVGLASSATGFVIARAFFS